MTTILRCLFGRFISWIKL